MYRTFASLNLAYAYLRTTHANQRLWSILKFDTSDTHYVFCSTATPGGQMFNISRNILTQSGHYGRGLPHGRELATFMSDYLVHRARGGLQPGRHAEEWLISHLGEILPHIPAPQQAVILNSDTPCSLLDVSPSANLAGWPVSCTRKFACLAQLYPTIEWTVLYKKKYGGQGGHSPKQIGQYFQQCRNDYPGGRIAIFPYTQEMQNTAAAFEPF